MKFNFLQNKSPQRREEFDILIDGEFVEVTVRWNAQAKRLIMRVDPRSGDVSVTLPKRASLKQARKFIEERIGWISDQREDIVAAAPLACGEIIDFKGISHSISFTDIAPRKIWIEDDCIYVGGPVDLAAGRLQRWLKKQAKQALVEAVDRHAETLGLDFNAVSVTDTKSRWGSCSSKKNLRFSWRLVLAPPEILNYVAAHEVAHLEEMNHSQDFWDLVEICDAKCKTHRRWLKSEGQRLFAMGNV